LKGDEQIRNAVGVRMPIGRRLTLTRHGTSEGRAAMDESVSGGLPDVDESPNQVFDQPTL
jgi:hypothetical protein